MQFHGSPAYNTDPGRLDSQPHQPGVQQWSTHQDPQPHQPGVQQWSSTQPRYEPYNVTGQYDGGGTGGGGYHENTVVHPGHQAGAYSTNSAAQPTHPARTYPTNHTGQVGNQQAGTYQTYPSGHTPNQAGAYPTNAVGHSSHNGVYPTNTANSEPYQTSSVVYPTKTSAYPNSYASPPSHADPRPYSDEQTYYDPRVNDDVFNASTYIGGTDPTSRDPYAGYPTSNSPSRRRKFGRDHTNYTLPPNLDPFKNTPLPNSALDGTPLIDTLNHVGPPGLPLSSDGFNGYDSETGLKLVVVDKTDDEDENVDPGQPGYGSRSNSDVFPIDKNAIERDLYKQEYDPTVTSFKPNMNPSINTVSRHVSTVNDPGVNPDGFKYQNSSSAGQTFAFHVTDYDSEIENSARRTGTGMLREPFTNNQHFFSGKPKLGTISSQSQYPKPKSRAFQSPDLEDDIELQQYYTMSHIDYERYTSNQSQLSTVMEDTSGLDTFRSEDTVNNYDVFKGEKSKTFLIHPSATVSRHNINEARATDNAVLGPGYKFQVNKYNMVKRASILNRAEQLLDARRGHFNDSRSESSDEVRRLAEDEDDDSVSDMAGARHAALKHVKQRQFDDSTSYNSSDDVINTLKYHPRGPVTQTARRARLTSVNARLNKQKRIRAARRQNIPLSHASDDDVNSPLSDANDQPNVYRKVLRDKIRYEQAKFRETGVESRNRRQLQIQPQHQEEQSQEEGTSAIKGRRVFMFRNGDLHFKPKQILISQKTYTNLEKLLVDLSSMVETSTGVKYIFSWPEGREIKSITEFENGKYYVCSSTSKLQRVDYGSSKEGPWKGGKIDRKENFLFQQDGKVQSPLRRPRVLTIISNMYRDSREKLILNTNSQMNFEDILNDIGNMINVPNPPVRALYTERAPHQKVESYSQLIREFGDHDNFLACGEEMVPTELSPKKPSGPGNAVKKGARRNRRSDAGRTMDDDSLSPARDSDTTYVNDTGQGRSNRRQQVKGRKSKPDSIKVDINGKTREFFPPTTLNEEDDGRKPDKKLKLDWVYGFRGRDVKQNLAVLPSSGQLVYFVAAVVVLHDKKFATQKHYLGHSEEITCLAIHPNGRFIASGQTSGKTPESGAHVRVWDGTSLSTYAVIGLGTFQQGIACHRFIAIPPQVMGELLMAIDDSDRHQLTVWDWQTEKMVARTTTTTDPVVSGCFYPQDETILMTYGKEHIHFWKMFWDKGRKIMRDKLSGNFEENIPKFVTSVCFSPAGEVITGDSTGAILIWSRDNNNVFTVNAALSRQTRKAHKKSVAALCMLGDGTLLSGGGNEVKAWDSINNYSPVKERVLPATAGHVRSIVPITKGGLDGSIYVSTTRNKVLEGSLQLKFKFIIQGHVEELWAVESHPLEQTFVSAGHDQMVVKWSAISHAPVWRVNAENPCTCISIDPKGRIIALGTTAGKVIILNSYNGAVLTSLPSGNVQINALSFSPDGKQLAVGTYDGFLQIFYLQDEGQAFFRPQPLSLKHSNMFIMHLDWSVDSKCIQAVLGDYDIVHWDIPAGQKIKTARAVRDVKWATHNCPIGHSIIGPWQNLDRGDVINVVTRSQYRDMMVVGDSKGRLRLYKWPCSVAKAGFHNTKCFSSNVTCAAFTCDDGYVIASGGNDAALMQFTVLDPVSTR
ncbi:unnamed protein product [Lymnaea stagnalis]|uniref:Doublecortin domain-containing protein n=1 Tax=Lymnaea stagnalis TaxID=6523 RepID=A0AAV2I2E9_LYMST